MPDDQSTSIKCSCGEHLIQLDRFGDPTLYMTLWSPISSKERGRWYWVWQSLRGRWNGDNEVVLDPRCARLLRDALTEHVNAIGSMGYE